MICVTDCGDDQVSIKTRFRNISILDFLLLRFPQNIFGSRLEHT